MESQLYRDRLTLTRRKGVTSQTSVDTSLGLDVLHDAGWKARQEQPSEQLWQSDVQPFNSHRGLRGFYPERLADYK